MTPDAPPIRYRLLSLVLLPFWLLHAIAHGFKHQQNDYLAQRLGLHHRVEQPSIWVHAASVGEVNLIEPLVVELLQQDMVTVTTFTASGYRHARRTLPASVLVQVLPIDFWWFARCFFKRHDLKLCLVAETELWPEMLYQAKMRQLPLLQINARLSDKTLHSKNWLKPILKTTLAYFDTFLTRNPDDGKRLQSLGISADRIVCCGNLKSAARLQNVDFPRLVERPYILFASSHDPEEKAFVALMQQLGFPLLCVIAPRHPQRGGEIMRALEDAGYRLTRRSQDDEIDDKTQVYLADTLGELRALMQHAELVVMGGSFNRVGGHNVLEPSALGKAVITGPSDNNIRDDLSTLLQNHAIVQVADYAELGGVLKDLLENPTARAQLEQNAQAITADRAGVLSTYIEQIGRYRW